MIFGHYILYKKKFGEKILQKLQPENQFQALLCLQRIKYNFYWKKKLLKEATYIRYASAKLTKFVQTSIQTSSDFSYRRFFENQKVPGTSYNIATSKTKSASLMKQKTFYLFQKCFLLDMQNKLAKMQRTQPLTPESEIV